MSTSTPPERARPGARELARRAVIDQVASMAVDLFVERGYEQTTIEDICAAAGISRSSFFRYFQTKEDVLLREFADVGDGLTSGLAARPDGESPWAALRQALQPLAEQYATSSGRTLRSVKLVMDNPSLATFHQDKLARWAEVLRPEVARRIGSDPDDLVDPRPAALIGAAFVCLDAALAAWATAGGVPSLPQLLDRAMDSFS